MASLCGRIAVSAMKKNVLTSSYRLASTKLTLGDPVEHATGLEKREILAKMAGNPDPFDIAVLARGPGTKEKPNEIPSAFDARIVGCVCADEASSVNWMWLHKGQPRRCECGHWFTLVPRTPL